MAAEANEALVNALTRYAKEAAVSTACKLPPAERRQLDVLKNSLTMSAPPDPKEAEELTRLVASMEGAYGRGKYCPGGDGQTTASTSRRSPRSSRRAAIRSGCWRSGKAGTRSRCRCGRTTRASSSCRTRARARSGYADTGAMWRGKYNMPPDAFAAELDRLWEQLRPLYVSLHAYVRAQAARRSTARSSPRRVRFRRTCSATCGSRTGRTSTAGRAGRARSRRISLTERLKAKKIEPLEMVRIGERFFTSLGFEPLPKTFWERSLFVKPRDREVVCHASAWDIDNVDDLRIKMCIDVTAEDFTTIHHELGHNFYQRAYNTLPVIFRDSANDGFHEALGDTLALSVTPEYLVKIGLLDKAPDASADTALLLRAALERLAFLPFGLLVDQWRWQVFSGKTTPADYNQAWWELKLRYQGVAPPSPRGEEFFDPGAKYHVPANTPYARYFLAQVLQFQFHRALAKAAGCTAPLHRCSIYGSKEAGRS